MEEVARGAVSRQRAAKGPDGTRRRDERFAKSRRVLKRADFLRVQRQGIGARGRSYVVVVRRRGDPDPARLGVVASRKVGGAVARNRGKRLVREWFRRRSEPVPAGIDVVVILRLGAAELAFEAACSELEATLAKALRRRRGAGGRSRRRPAGRADGKAGGRADGKTSRPSPEPTGSRGGPGRH